MVENMRRHSSVAIIALLAALGLVLNGCEKIDPDQGQRNSMSDSVIQAAREGDNRKLLDLSAVDMQDRETAADALIASARKLNPRYKVEYQEHHGAPDNYIVSATDDQGASTSFELSWHQGKWQLILGTAGPPRSPAATVRPSS